MSSSPLDLPVYRGLGISGGGSESSRSNRNQPSFVPVQTCLWAVLGIRQVGPAPSEECSRTEDEPGLLPFQPWFDHTQHDEAVGCW